MLRKIPILILTLICLMSALLSAQQNHYTKARQGLREAYEHVTGVSLKDAIDQLIAEKRGDKFANGNVIVRFNGGGVRNKLFIGRENTLEILVTNDYDLQAVTMAFEFICTSGPNTFSWVEGYGPIPGGGESVVIMHDDGFPYGDSWTSQYWAPNRPDSIQLGGVAWTSSQYLGVNSSPTLLFSMQIELPDDPSMVGDTFYVDNIVHPPAGNWFFQEAPPGSSLGYAPDFQYNPNQSKFNPDAPPVGFEIAAPMCEFAGKASNPNIAYISEDSLIRPSQLSRVAFDPEATSQQEISVRVGYAGNKEDLKKYVSSGRIFKVSKDVLGFAMNLSMLPELCQEQGVLYVKSVTKITPQLNYSTDDINCVYSIIQDSLHVSGDNVIVGVLDRGIDWLHQDFIDSNGNTRILAFWDQTDTTGSHPSNPYFDFGSELSYATINSYVHSSPPPHLTPVAIITDMALL